MGKLKIPDGYQTVMPYLVVKDAKSFLLFVQQVFGATEKMKMLDEKNMIRHAEFQVGDSVIMFADSTNEYPPRGAGMFVYVADVDEVHRKAISLGAASIAAPEDKEYGRSAGVEDKFGNMWWITNAQ